jgi:TPR repeat protein
MLDFQTLVSMQHNTDRGRAMLRNAAAAGDALALLYISCLGRIIKSVRPPPAPSRWVGLTAWCSVRVTVPGLGEINNADALSRLRREPADPVVLFVLGLCLYYGIGDVEDRPAAVSLYRQAAVAGLGLAVRHLGVCYARGDGAPQSFADAAACFERAGAQGYADALSFLGNCYRNGEGVPCSPQRAFELYQQAAEAGFAVAQHNAGKCLLAGEGTRRDTAAGVRWLREAAAQGDARARGALAALGDESGAGEHVRSPDHA